MKHKLKGLDYEKRNGLSDLPRVRHGVRRLVRAPEIRCKEGIPSLCDDIALHGRASAEDPACVGLSTRDHRMAPAAAPCRPRAARVQGTEDGRRCKLHQRWRLLSALLVVGRSPNIFFKGISKLG